MKRESKIIHMCIAYQGPQFFLYTKGIIYLINVCIYIYWAMCLYISRIRENFAIELIASRRISFNLGKWETSCRPTDHCNVPTDTLVFYRINLDIALSHIYLRVMRVCLRNWNSHLHRWRECWQENELSLDIGWEFIYLR